MEYAPSIDWGLALRVARRTAGDLPEVPRADLAQLVAGLKVAARRAGALAADHLGLDGEGAGTVRVVDWQGWARGIRRMTDGVVAALDLPAREASAATAARALANAGVAGIALGRIGPRLLGQYDALSGDDTLYLIAPSILRHERSYGFAPADFRLWVGLHEQTHALQLRAAPWLRQFLLRRMRVLIDDDISLGEGVRQWVRTGEVKALLASGEARAAMEELTSAMTFLEGHADHVADAVGATHVPTLSRLRSVFSHEHPPGLLARLSSSLDKSAQYRDGLAFCTHVSQAAGPRGLRVAFAAPESLPTKAEIADPGAWLARVHG